MGAKRRFHGWLASWLQDRRRKRRFAGTGIVPLAPDEIEDLLGWWDPANVNYDSGTYDVQDWPASNPGGPQLVPTSFYSIPPVFDVAEEAVEFSTLDFLSVLMSTASPVDLTLLVVGSQDAGQAGSPRYISVENDDLWLPDYSYAETMTVVHTPSRGPMGAFEGQRNVDNHSWLPTVQVNHTAGFTGRHIGVVRKSGTTMSGWLQYTDSPTVLTASGSTEYSGFSVDTVSVGGAALAGGPMDGRIYHAAVWLRGLTDEEVEAVMAYFAGLYA